MQVEQNKYVQETPPRRIIQMSVRRCAETSHLLYFRAGDGRYPRVHESRVRNPGEGSPLRLSALIDRTSRNSPY